MMMSVISINSNLRMLVTVSLLSLCLFSCSKKTSDDGTASGASDDDSVSGTIVSAVGGALSSSNSSGTLASNNQSSQSHFLCAQQSIWNLFVAKVQAATSCPTILTAGGSGCAISGAKVDLTYSSCSFGSLLATHTGTMELSTSDNSSLTCGTFPTLGSNVYFQRQFVSVANTPGTGTRTSARGVAVVVDHQTANLGNFDNVTIAANIGTGYGTRVQFDGAGKRKAVEIKERLYVDRGFDHSVDGSLTISDDGTIRTVSGVAKVYHNKVKVIGTTTLSALAFDKSSCIPTSGTISMTFTAGANVEATAIGKLMVGKTESLQFIGSNQATYTAYDGSTKTVELSHCF